MEKKVVKPKSNWWCSSEEAIEHEKTCKDTKGNCGICVAILSTSVAMEEYGTEVTYEPEVDDSHPLFDQAMEIFNGRKVD
jgi:hypothetical protein